MEKINLVAELRSTTEKLSEVRSAKNIPAVVYGHNAENIIIKLNNSDFLRTFRKSGQSHIINLTIDGKKYDVLVHDVQKEPVLGNFIHVDFKLVVRGEAVHTHIPLSFIGASQAVKEGAILEEQIKELEIKCLPSDLVDNFEVDLSRLSEMGSSIRVSDLGIDSKYTILTTADEIVVSATMPAKAVEISDEAPVAPVIEDEKEEK